MGRWCTTSSRDMRFAVAIVGAMAIAGGCQKSDYFVGEVTEQKVLGTWAMAAIPNNVPRPPVPLAECQLTLKSDGNFEAHNFPLVVELSPKVEVKYVSERGTWKLSDNTVRGLRSRWKLNLSFGTSRFEVAWDLIGSSKVLRLFGMTDLDYWVGFEFAPSVDERK